MKEYALAELNDWMEYDQLFKTYTHEDYNDVTCYVSRSRDIICVRKDADGNVVDAWME